MTFLQLFLFFLAGLLLLACAPNFNTSDNVTAVPQLADSMFISFDGTELPLNTWLPPAQLKAVFIVLHGYNDYSAFFRNAAPYFNDREIGIYAYDQRGFGAEPTPGRWSGHETMIRDLRTFIPLVQKRHPDVPLYLLGDSMGGAVLMSADTPDNPLPGDGVILVAPAVWSRKTMPFYQRWALSAAARLVPWLKVSPEGLDITPSDNIEMLRELGRDPLVLKESRIDSLYGLTDLMDAAYEASARFNKKALFLYGARDEIIPAKPMAHVFLKRLKGSFSEPQRLLLYENGYHMLLRDLQAETVWQDIVCWLNSPAGAFPSVREKAAREIRDEEEIATCLYPGVRD
ncbi:MAG: alpha/beta hydrolase [Desulfobulbaceae bacterium]|nr:alpha/beta hydrolase [Desulfobulbaceae bacterium]